MAGITFSARIGKKTALSRKDKQKGPQKQAGYKTVLDTKPVDITLHQKSIPSLGRKNTKPAKIDYSYYPIYSNATQLKTDKSLAFNPALSVRHF